MLFPGSNSQNDYPALTYFTSTAYKDENLMQTQQDNVPFDLPYPLSGIKHEDKLYIFGRQDSHYLAIGNYAKCGHFEKVRINHKCRRSSPNVASLIFIHVSIMWYYWF